VYLQTLLLWSCNKRQASRHKSVTSNSLKNNTPIRREEHARKEEEGHARKEEEEHARKKEEEHARKEEERTRRKEENTRREEQYRIIEEENERANKEMLEFFAKNHQDFKSNFSSRAKIFFCKKCFDTDPSGFNKSRL